MFLSTPVGDSELSPRSRAGPGQLCLSRTRGTRLWVTGQRRARCVIPHREEDDLRQDSGVARNLDLPAW